MSYHAMARGGEIRTRSESDAKKAIAILEDLGIDSTLCGDESILDVTGSKYISYDENNFIEVARLSIGDSYICFMGEDDMPWTLKFEDGKPVDYTGEILWDHREREAKKITIPLGDGRSLVVERGPDPEYREFIIGLEDPECYYQDLVVVGQEYRGNGYYLDEFAVKVYSDPNSEDYVGPPIIIPDRTAEVIL